MLQPGDKLDLAFVMKSNRSDSLAKLERVEWLIASAPPTPVADNHAPGMTCAAPTSTSNGFNGTFSSKLSSGAVTVPANIAYGTYNLYLRGLGNTTTCSTLATYSYPITPLFELKNAIVFEPLVQHIKVVPSQLPPQPPATVGKNDVAITWEVKFYQPVKDVSENVFRLVTAGIGGAGASIVSVTGSGSVYYVTTKVPAGSVAPDQLASLRLDFDDDDSVLSATGDRPIGGTGHGNGNFTGETYALKGTICGASNVIWCDDFERSVQGSAKADLVGNGWVATTDGNCGSHTPGSSYQPDAGGCAGIDSDIKPYHNYANPRANSSRSMFNRWLAHAVTSEAIDLSGLPADAAVELSYWLRRGSDSFAEEPDESTANFMAEYLDKNSKWQMLAQHRATGGHAVAGEILRPVFQLPAEALWSGFRLRFRQNHGTGTASHSSATVVNGYDYWFIDDVVLRRIDAPRYAGGFCDNFEAPASSLKQWSFGHEDIATGADTEDLRIGEAGVTGDVYPTNGSSKHSMFLRWSYVVASTMRIDTRGLGGNIRYVAQRGMKNPPGKINGADVLTACDSTTANPKDKFVSEYFGGDGKWHALQSVEGVSGSSSCGQDISYASAALSGLPNAQHENFRLRFRQLSYSGYQTGNQHYDYWLVDDVCVGRTDGTFPRADLELTKTRENTLYPGGIGIYVLSAKNNGPDRMRGTLQIVDTLPSAMSFYDFQGSGWFCEADGQTVTCSWSGDLEKGQRAPDLRLYALVSPSATGVLKNKGTLSSGAVEDPVPGNNTSEDEGAIETIYFAFTKGQCKNGQAIGDVTSSAACSRYRFDGLAGETRSGIYITHTNVSGVTA
ncbi:MAG: DUF11 domain-containing protein, partial [Azoarcus sp.]|nr:DUF11 domain-containing protein [Azoarcus sp.]